MWFTDGCGQLTSVWFGSYSWQRYVSTSSLARSVRWPRPEAVSADDTRFHPNHPEPSREAYIPAQQPPPSPQARVPCAHEHPGGTRRAQIPSRQGPRPSVGLIDRVRERDAFIRLRREGQRVRTDSLWCSFVLDPDLLPPQVAFAIGRAVGSAVRRNRLRRRLRALLARSDVPAGLYLVGAQAHACELTFDELERSVTALFGKIRQRQRAT